MVPPASHRSSLLDLGASARWRLTVRPGRGRWALARVAGSHRAADAAPGLPRGCATLLVGHLVALLVVVLTPAIIVARFVGSAQAAAP